jgi:hypothetical protein
MVMMQPAVAPETEAEIGRCYSTTRAKTPDGMSITVLPIGANQTTIPSATGPAPSASIALAIGSTKIPETCFRPELPRAREIKNAIQVIDGEVSRARKTIAIGSRLFTADADVATIVLMAGIPDGSEAILTREAMERVFARLAAATLGSPAGQEAVPASATFAATLLLLHECMHHLQFPSITITAQCKADMDIAMCSVNRSDVPRSASRHTRIWRWRSARTSNPRNSHSHRR